jgi:hypothetical protein
MDRCHRAREASSARAGGVRKGFSMLLSGPQRLQIAWRLNVPIMDESDKLRKPDNILKTKDRQKAFW